MDIERALEYFRCPRCRSHRLEPSEVEVRCRDCGAGYPIDEGVVDFFPDYGRTRDPVQVWMERPAMVRVYENHVRPLYHSFASPITYEEERQWLLKQHQQGDAECVLDIGCGTGRYSRVLAGAYHSGLVIGIDLSMPMLRRARQMATERNFENLVFVHGDAQCLPIRDGVAGAINSFAAMHLFPDPYKAVEEMGRCGAPRARVSCLLICKLADGPRTWRQRLFLLASPFRPHLEPGLLEAKFAASGFEGFEYRREESILLSTATHV